MKAAIIGLAGPQLAPEEARLLRHHAPVGVILFARNVDLPDQLRALIGDVRTELPDALLMVDQEGGRVARLKPPHWRAHPSAAALARGGERAAFLSGALIGVDGAAVGFDVVAAPVLDRRIMGASDVVGDRSFGTDRREVARLGRAQADGLGAAGVIPVMKHLPGHGAATVDSHLSLPVVRGQDEAADLLPFVLNAGLPWAMTAHILYPGWDTERPATLSSRIIERIIRGRIAFEGVLVSDDLAMQALSGTPAERARAALAAGCDIALYCAGTFDTTASVLEACPSLTPSAEARLALGRAWAAARRVTVDADALAAERDRLVA